MSPNRKVRDEVLHEEETPMIEDQEYTQPFGHLHFSLLIYEVCREILIEIQYSVFSCGFENAWL